MVKFTNQDSIHLSDSLKYYTLRKHRVVYGGGGIMPDYFVPLDTTKYTNCIVSCRLRALSSITV